LLFEILSIRHACVFRLRFGFWNWFGRGNGILSNFVLLVFLSKPLTGLFIILLALASLVAPSLTFLLGVLTM